MPTKQVSRETRSLRAVLDNPALPALVQSLPARKLAQLCGRIGIGDAAQIMALAPAERLVQALEASVWKAPRPGVAEIFDVHELVEWIRAWLDIGEAFTAERLSAVPDENLMLYLSQLADVTTGAMWGFERSTEIEDLDRIYAPSYDETAYGPYVVSARRQEDWEILRGSLDAMGLDAPERLLYLLAQLVGDESMAAPQRNRESSNDDVALARDIDRERHGYVTASGARAFLAQARSPLKDLAELTDYDLETRRFVSGLTSHIQADAMGGPGGSDDVGQQPVASEGEDDAKDGQFSALAMEEARLATLQTVLEEAGLLEAPPERLLLTHEATAKQLPIVRLLLELTGEDSTQFETRGRELAYLGSVLIAGVAVDGTALHPSEARNAALATCNLGLETLQTRGERIRLDRAPGLIRLFLVGFSVLNSLPGKVLETFVGCLKVLKRSGSEPLHAWLVEQAEISVADLSEAVWRGDFATAREATVALGFVFEPRACQAVVPLLDELPRLAAADGKPVTWIDSLASIESAAVLLRGIGVKRRRIS